jgi:HK97 family phage portal protein
VSRGGVMAFKWFKKREEPQTTERNNNGVTLGDPTTLSDVLLQTLLNGGDITREMALSIPAVSADIDFISNCIASMPVKLYKRKKKEDKDIVEEITDDTRVTLLNSDTGDTLDSFQLKKAMVTDYFLGQGGYCYIERFRNEVSSLYYVEDQYVVINYNFDPIFKSYKIYVGENTYYPFDFVKLLRNTKTGAWGVSIIEELGKALETAYQTQLYQLGLVKTGGNKRGFLKSERRLGNDEITALKNAWRNLYANNTESVVVLNNGLDFKEAANTSVEMQLNKSIDNLIKQIDKIFHICDNFYDTFKFAIYPVIRAFETALNRDLLLEKEKGKYFFEFDVKEIIKANIKERYEVYRMAKEIGFMSKNEIRRAENMNDIEGLDVIDFGLGSVLYDINTHTYYTPNTDATSQGGGYSNEDIKTIEEESFIDADNGTERTREEATNENNNKK